jgi:hypothetical protein
MSQNEQSDVVEKKPSPRSFLLNPIVMIIEAILLVCVIVGLTLANTQPSDHFTGTATVVSFTGTAKKCWVDLEKEDGAILNDFRMSQETCEHISEGDVVEVVKGKYLPEIASQQ